MNLSTEEIKERVPLQDVLNHYGHTDLPERNGRHFTCLFPENHARGDQKPSCNFYTGSDGLPRYKCLSCGEDGDQLSFVERREGVNIAEAKKIVARIGGIIEGGTYTAPQKPLKRPVKHEEKKPVQYPSDLSRGTETEWNALGELRHLDPQAVNLATELGVLKFGTHKGFKCWIVTDQSRIVAEARRLDGETFNPSGNKCDTLRNSKKSWPVGIQPRHRTPENFQKIILVEGSADLIAAYHFNHVFRKMDTLPVAILGRQCKNIHPEALSLFKGRDVRIMPHADEDGGGREAAERWAEQIGAAGAKSISGFDFSGLTRKDGKPVSDLNDCTVIRPEDESELEGLLR